MQRDITDMSGKSRAGIAAPGKLIMVLISALLVVCMAAGCTPDRSKDEPVDGQTAATAENGDREDPSAPEQPGGNENDSDEGGSGDRIPEITDKEISEAYQKAVEAFGWFELGTMPADYEDIREADGYQYNRVTHDRIKTYDDLRSYLLTIFTDEIVEGLLTGSGSDMRLYRDIDGALYTIPAGRGSDITKGEETYEIFRESDKKIVYRVTVEVYDDPFEQTVSGTEQFDFTYEYTDGGWVFTYFELVR
jgi:hypothetical protein